MRALDKRREEDAGHLPCPPPPDGCGVPAGQQCYSLVTGNRNDLLRHPHPGRVNLVRQREAAARKVKTRKWRPAPDVSGVGELAAYAGITRATAWARMRRPGAPRGFELAGGAVWPTRVGRAWVKDSKRLAPTAAERRPVAGVKELAAVTGLHEEHVSGRYMREPAAPPGMRLGNRRVWDRANALTHLQDRPRQPPGPKPGRAKETGR